MLVALLLTAPTDRRAGHFLLSVYLSLCGFWRVAKVLPAIFSRGEELLILTYTIQFYASPELVRRL